ncbi:hypothetical protein DL765_005005 [Monosporascus sp. GIB2]|nr:hypothetical protein DL765_005005 [Monosporascus sp. GIB2]
MENLNTAVRGPRTSNSGSSKTTLTPSPVETWLKESPRDAPWSAVNLRPQQGGKPPPQAGDDSRTVSIQEPALHGIDSPSTHPSTYLSPAHTATTSPFKLTCATTEAIQAMEAGITAASGKVQARISTQTHIQQSGDGSGRGPKPLRAACPIDTWLMESPREAPWNTINLRSQQGGEWRPGPRDTSMTAARL